MRASVQKRTHECDMKTKWNNKIRKQQQKHISRRYTKYSQTNRRITCKTNKRNERTNDQTFLSFVANSGLHSRNAGANSSKRDSTRNERGSRTAHGYCYVHFGKLYLSLVYFPFGPFHRPTEWFSRSIHMQCFFS